MNTLHPYWQIDSLSASYELPECKLWILTRDEEPWHFQKERERTG